MENNTVVLDLETYHKYKDVYDDFEKEVSKKTKWLKDDLKTLEDGRYVMRMFKTFGPSKYVLISEDDVRSIFGQTMDELKEDLRITKKNNKYLESKLNKKRWYNIW